MTAIDVAEGGAMVDESHHVDRGYERIGEKFARRVARVRGVPP